MRSGRAYMACNECRRKKIKCDSNLPSCSACIKGRISCIYKPRSKNRRRATLEELSTLKLENDMLKKKLRLIGTSDAFLYYVASNASNLTNVTNTTNVSETLAELESVCATHRKVYGLIKKDHSFLVNDREFQETFSQLSLLEFHTLLENYWKFENVNIMVVWKKLLLFDLLSQHGSAEEYSSKSLIMAILAVGSTFSCSKTLIAKGYNFFKLSCKYLKETELWNLRITTPQTICLLCMFEHARGNKAEALYYSRLAVNCALELELNIDNFRKSDSFTKNHETVRRFTWWSCYQIDMLVRVSARQAPTVKKEIIGVNPPQVSPYRYILGLSEEIQESYFEFYFISTITLELFVIAGESLEFCYARWPSITIEKKREKIEKCINELTLFWETAKEKLSRASSQILTFKLRFYYTNIVLTGYFLEPQMLIPDEYELKSLDTCIHFAGKLLSCLEDYSNLYGIWTLETFVSDFIPTGLTVMLCAINFDNSGEQCKIKYNNDAKRFIKLMLSFPNQERYTQNLRIIRTLLTEWECNLFIDQELANW